MRNEIDELHLTELNDEELAFVSGGSVESPWTIALYVFD